MQYIISQFLKRLKKLKYKLKWIYKNRKKKSIENIPIQKLVKTNLHIPLSSSSSVVELSVDSFTSDFPLLAIDRAENKLFIFD